MRTEGDMAPQTAEVVLSLTTYPPRLAGLGEALASLQRQTVAPDRICLWLAEDDFPDREEPLRALGQALESGAVEVRWCPRTLGPHDKYFWTMQAHPDAVVITVDDDIRYPPDLVERLLAAHEEHPSAVVARRTHLVRALTEEGQWRLAPYDSWVLEQRLHQGEPRHDLLATGVGGILYPPHTFDEAVFDEEAIRGSALFTDDLWLFVHELRLGIPVVGTAPYELDYVAGSQACALCHENLERGGNDGVLAALFERFPRERALLLSQARDNEASRPSLTEEETPAMTAMSQPRSPFARLKRRLIGR